VLLLCALTEEVQACGAAQVVILPAPVSSLSIQAAVNVARLYFSAAACMADEYTINLPAGTFLLGQPPQRSNGAAPLGAIDVSGVLSPNATGKLIINGAGEAENGTTLRLSNDVKVEYGYPTIYGRSAYHVTFQNMHLGAEYPTVSQGRVQSINVSDNSVTLTIPEGFPTPLDLFNATLANPKGRYLRAYTDDAVNPTLVQDVAAGSAALFVDNRQVPWGYVGGTYKAPVPDPSGPNSWRIYINHAAQDMSATGAYAPGRNMICIKAKSYWGGYNFLNSQYVTFNHIIWTEVSRGVFRAGSANNTVMNAAIIRGPAIGGQTPCLSTSDGGPQFGQPGEPTYGNTVLNFTAQATGDDSVAFFDDEGGTGLTPQPAQSVIENLDIENSFARFVLVSTSPGLGRPNFIIRTPITVVGCDELALGINGCPITYYPGL